MGAVRIGRRLRHEGVLGRQRLPGAPRAARELGERDRAVGADDPHRAVGDFEIAGAGFERIGGELLEIVRELFRRARDRGAAAGDRARAAGAGAGRDAVGVALDHAHALGRKSEMLGDDLRIGGGVPLPGRLRADQHGDAAVVVEPHARGVGPVVAAGLDIGRDADAAQPPGFLRSRQPALEAGQIGDLLRALEVGGESRRNRRSCRSRSCRASPWLDEILPPQRVGRDAELARGGVDQPLDHIGRLRPPGAAIGVDRHGVGERRRARARGRPRECRRRPATCRRR